MKLHCTTMPTHHPWRRRAGRAALATLTLLVAAACSNPGAPPPAAGPAAATATAKDAPLRYLGQQIIPSLTLHGGLPFGGLSGIDCEPGTTRCLALSDDRATLGPARFYTLSLDLAAFERRADAGADGVQVLATTRIKRPDGSDWGRGETDPESLRLTPAGRLLWTDEGQRSRAPFVPPAVREMDREGRHVRSFGVPAHFLPQGSPGGEAAGDCGVRNNLAFESLALSPDGRRLWVASEGALAQDGPMPTLSAGTPVRLLAIDMASGQPGVEHAYVLEPVPLPPQPADGPAGNGLVELLALDETRFIAVERSWARGAATPGQPRTGNTVRLFLVDTTGATDVSGLDSLRGRDWVPVQKTLLLALNDLRHDDGTPLATDNIEAIAWGPRHQGRPTLVLVADNNFNPRQFTQVLVLTVHGELAR